MEKLFQKNSGFIPADPAPSDYIAGGITGIYYEERNPSGDWQAFLPLDERQAFRNFDSMACVTFSAMNSLETQLNFLYAQNKIPPWLVKWLQDAGYIVGDRFNFSDRFIAKLSGTTMSGNTFQKVWDAIRKCGLLPEKDWPTGEEFHWDDYYAPIPDSVKVKAKEFLKYFNIQYEWVTSTGSASYGTIDKQLKQAPLHLATAVCSGWFNNSIVSACDLPVSHATMIFDIEPDWTDIYDTYPEFQRRLSPNYKLQYIMKGLITIKTQEITTEMVRHAWLQRPDLQTEFPATLRFVNKNTPTYDIYDWAKDFGVYEMPEVFSPSYKGTEVILQVEDTDAYYLYGPGGTQVNPPFDGEVKIISQKEAQELGFDISVKKKRWWEIIIDWLKGR